MATQKKFYDHHLDLTDHELRNASKEVLAAAPASPVKGRFYFDSVINAERIWDGAKWLQNVTKDIMLGLFKGSAATFASLPSASNQTGDIAALTADNVGTGTVDAPQYPAGLYKWNGTAWAIELEKDDRIITQTEAEAGTATTPRRWTAERVYQAIIKQFAIDTNTTSNSNIIAASTAWCRYGLVSSFGVNGYIRFPTWLGSLTIQWGSDTTAANGTTFTPYPIVFNSIFNVMIADRALSQAQIHMVSVDQVNINQFLARATTGAGVNASTAFYWVAIGT
jgi:hypothetical protein